MQTSNSITIHAPYERIYELASRVERWPEILPHYRYVKVLRQEGDRRLVRMSAWRDIVPVTWSAIVTIERGTAARPGRLLFKHVRGLVKGMDVVWNFEPRGESFEVTISHDLKQPGYPVRILGSRLIDLIVGRGFIGYIAGKTLARIKHLAESEEHAHSKGDIVAGEAGTV